MQVWWFLVRVHPTWHFTVFSAGLVLGLGLSVVPSLSVFSSYIWLVVAALLGAFVMWKRWRWLLIVALISGALVGLARGTLDVSERARYAALTGKTIQLTGRVAEDPDVSKRGEMQLRLTDVSAGEHKITGQLWVSLSQRNTIMRSDNLTVKGKLSAGFGNFTLSMYQAAIVKIERSVPGDIALHVRDNFGEKVRQGIAEPSASLGMGYLTGQKRSLPEDLMLALQVAGLTHIVVASGYNLTVLVRGIKRLVEKHSRYLTVFLSLILIGSFVAVAGISPSMTRAALISVLALFAWYFGRKFHPVTLLLFAAAVTGLITPSNVWGNLGWQLSFAAFGGVMILAPLLQAYFYGDKKPRVIRRIIGETISAQVATAPLILLAFGTFSNVAILANILILPLVPVAMMLTFITGLVGYISGSFAQVIGMPAQGLLDYMVWVAETTAGLGWAQSEASLPMWGLLACYAAIVTACVYMQRVTRLRLRETNIVE